MSSDITTVVDLLKQAYMEQDWKVVLECIEILQTDEEDETYQNDEFNDLDF
tara:strand:- start:47 stop:199 length:153 start_codon:yes stop_codon:yes gene_type:complete